MNFVTNVRCYKYIYSNITEFKRSISGQRYIQRQFILLIAYSHATRFCGRPSKPATILAMVMSARLARASSVLYAT